jgi:hypothetical protein
MNACHPQETAILESQLTFHWSQPAPPSPSSRTLKIEEEGDFWKRASKPKIRLMGRWLERAGFRPGSRVLVTCVAPGILELRCPRCGVGE